MQVKAKYSLIMAELFRETFCFLPLAHCLNRRVLVVHGGLFSRDGVTLDDIARTNRNRYVPSLHTGFCIWLTDHVGYTRLSCTAARSISVCSCPGSKTKKSMRRRTAWTSVCKHVRLAGGMKRVRDGAARVSAVVWHNAMARQDNGSWPDSS